MKRFAALILAGVLAFSGIPSESVVASELTTSETLSEQAEEMVINDEKDSKANAENEEQTPDTGNQTEELLENKQEEEKIEEQSGKSENIPDNENSTELTEILPEEQTLDEKDTDGAKEQTEESEVAPLLNYVYLDYSQITAGETQNIVVSVGEDDAVFENAVLYIEGNGGERRLNAQNIAGNAVLFTDTYGEEDLGFYCLNRMDCVIDDKEYSIDFLTDEIDTIEYVVASDADDEFSEIAVIDEDGNQTAAASIEEAIKAANENVSTQEEGKLRSANSDVIVVLDPGHDSAHPGASHNGLNEEKLTLKIAQYCKAELETYNGVKVYMTRTGESCPYPGTTSTDDNAGRVDYAKSVGADVYVSIHLNSSPSSSASGSEVYYPNSNYVQWIGTEGKELANQVLSQLAALGLADRGVKIRNSEDGTTYPDGSLADYYGVIRRSKEAGFPGIIVEHAFLTNTNDVNNFLSSEAGLQKLGVADAEGIAKYFGFTKGPTDFSFSGLTVSDMNTLAGTFTVELKGVSPAEKVEKLDLCVWSSTNGQDDIKKYSLPGNTTGNYTYTIDIKDHNNDAGNYNIHVYVTDKNGYSKYLGGIACNMTYKPLDMAELSATATDAQQKQFILKAAGVSDAQSLRFAVWNASNSNNIKWYAASKDGNGNWQYTLSISDFKLEGTYYVHAYAVDNGKKQVFVGGTAFNVDGPTVDEINVSEKDEILGRMKVNIAGVLSPSGIQSVKAAVWTQDNQKDLMWYEATREDDGTYSYWVDISNHSYNYGTYIMHVYVTDGNGIYKYGTGLREKIERPNAIVSATINAPNTWFQIMAKDFPQYGGAKQVKAAVWSAANGQDDLKWYALSKKDDGCWLVPVPVNYHKSEGLYYVHVYMENLKGDSQFIGGTTFEVQGPSAENVISSNLDELKGTFDVKIEGAQSLSGISAVEVAVFSKDDQSDLKWYAAESDESGNWIIHANIANHGYNYGTYRVHVYMTAGNGICKYVGGVRVKVIIPKAKISSAINAPNTWFSVYAKDVRIEGGVKEVKAGVWSSENGQDDLKWYRLGQTADGDWQVPVPVSYHKTEGLYYAHVYVTSLNGSSRFLGGTSFSVQSVNASGVQVTNQNDSEGAFTVMLTGVSCPSGVEKVEAGVWQDGKGNVKWYQAINSGNGNYHVNINAYDVGSGVGKYNVHFYATDGNGIRKFVGGVSHTINGYLIMGKTEVSVLQMVNYFKANAEYPSYYANTEAPTIEAFCQLYAEEAGAEGLKAEVAFCQAMKETGFLKFGGDVNISQFNFAGIGATGNGVPGNSFDSVRTGVRAHIQHLKAYASTDSLVMNCVDPRFQYVKRGCAPYVEWLGVKENPNGYGWATATGYGANIVQRIKSLKTF